MHYASFFFFFLISHQLNSGNWTAIEKSVPSPLIKWHKFATFSKLQCWCMTRMAVSLKGNHLHAQVVMSKRGTLDCSIEKTVPSPLIK